MKSILALDTAGMVGRACVQTEFLGITVGFDLLQRCLGAAVQLELEDIEVIGQADRHIDKPTRNDVAEGIDTGLNWLGHDTPLRNGCCTDLLYTTQIKPSCLQYTTQDEGSQEIGRPGCVVQDADNSAAEDAHLIIFDRTPDKAWEEKVWRRAENHNGLQVSVWGM